MCLRSAERLLLNLKVVACCLVARLCLSLIGAHCQSCIFSITLCHPCRSLKLPQMVQSVLDRFTNDLTAAARRGQLDPLVGRDAELRRLCHILLRRTKNNPVLVGEPGTCTNADELQACCKS